MGTQSESCYIRVDLSDCQSIRNARLCEYMIQGFSKRRFHTREKYVLATLHNNFYVRLSIHVIKVLR